MPLIIPQLIVAQQSTLILDAFYSTQLRCRIPHYILLPPGYEGSADHYPVIYLPRGAEHE